MEIFSSEITGSPPIKHTANSYVDIPGLSLTIPSAVAYKDNDALIILNVPMSYAEGNNFPGIQFSILVNGLLVAEGAFSYETKQPDSPGRMPFTLVKSIKLIKDQETGVKAQWMFPRKSVMVIDSLASISAIVA